MGLNSQQVNTCQCMQMSCEICMTFDMPEEDYYDEDNT